MAEGLAEDHVAMFRDALLQLLLQVTTAVLVLAQSRYLSLQVFQSRAGEAVDWQSKY